MQESEKPVRLAGSGSFYPYLPNDKGSENPPCPPANYLELSVRSLTKCAKSKTYYCPVFGKRYTMAQTLRCDTLTNGDCRVQVKSCKPLRLHKNYLEQHALSSAKGIETTNQGSTDTNLGRIDIVLPETNERTYPHIDPNSPGYNPFKKGGDNPDPRKRY